MAMLDVHYLCSLAMIGKLSFLTHHLYVISPQLLVSQICLFCTALLSLCDIPTAVGFTNLFVLHCFVIFILSFMIDCMLLSILYVILCNIVTVISNMQLNVITTLYDIV